MTGADFISFCHQIEETERPLIIGILTLIREHRRQEGELTRQGQGKPYVRVLRPPGGFDWHAVARRILQVQVATGLTDVQLAAEINMLPATIERWKRHPANMRMPHRAMHAFLDRHGFTLQWLLLGENLPAETAQKLVDASNVVAFGRRS